VDSLKERKFVPQTIFEKNVSPSLQQSKSQWQFLDAMKFVLKLL
jgi:hypothetical protein